MRLVEHLIEFRNRLIISAIAIAIGMVAGFFLTDIVLDLIRRPIETLQETREGRVSINFGNVTTGFDLRLQIALTLGIVVSSPVWLYQTWMFLMPGLKKGERRYIIGFLGAAIPLFLGGVALGFILMPRMIEVMAMFVPEKDTVFYDAKTYYSFVLTLCLAVGVAFVVPVILVMLNFAGILAGKTILGGWRWAILIAALFGGISTPAADVLSMVLLMLPMIALYFAAVGIALLHDKRQAKRDAKLRENLLGSSEMSRGD
ncbi:twin-arginine translocase subunit TatC [Gulosibacter chungangensis]|uniref:Sec-independent protein translocase protein TatC n=2 Tax=Gulosibacter chungangensis TaxID=979746 RepID=A0A7J5BFV3_9MICO|nr:twin-arginine translocase subunit TatC [Gulosibacter chungangensis]